MNNIAKNPQYGNCEVLNSDGQLMFRCNKKKIDWYLDRNLGVKVNDSPLTIKLTFTPNGNGHKGDPYHLQKMANRCVVCGSNRELNRHHVVPYCYRKFFPTHLKKHRSFDVLAICVDCHSKYEDHATELKENFAIKYNIPIDGKGGCYNNELGAATKAAAALVLYKQQIPLERQKALLDKVKLYLGKEPDQNDLEQLHHAKNGYNFDSYIPHGKGVVEQLSDIEAFIREWRQHFLDKMKPQFMPNMWKVDGPFLQSGKTQ